MELASITHRRYCSISRTRTSVPSLSQKGFLHQLSEATMFTSVTFGDQGYRSIFL
ncbi:hypothetical protein JG687_00016136 [Phytophthora cactorum]|uniref:Uncharacterized protein n=1 Tax=Phytophthora cactorum TaxID=29920 RepID=A0A8T1TWT3_9STRA|nr:hypothetical protein JG687_00016136 [Phytophthora cactorum]